MYEKGEFQCKKHVQAIQNHGSDSICTVCRCTHTFCILGECWKLCISLSSCIVFTIIIIAMYMNHCHPSIAHIHTTQPFQHVLSFPGSPSHSPTYWFTGNNRMDRRWFGLPFPWWQVPSRGQQLWGQIWDLTWISWCGPWNILKYTRHESGFSLALSTTTWRIVMRTWCPRERYVS